MKEKSTDVIHGEPYIKDAVSIFQLIEAAYSDVTKLPIVPGGGDSPSELANSVGKVRLGVKSR